jgi:3-methyladenine DNA glycosylase/8-oxoguanine DNA glycosylase
MYLMFELRRLDVWPVDDLGVRQGYGLCLVARSSADAPPAGH